MKIFIGYDSTNKYFQAGLLQYRTDESAALLTRQIVQADRKVIALRAIKNPTKLQKSELKRAEAERLSIPKNSSASDVYSLFANVLGGLGKFFSVVMASTFVAIITVVLSSAL